MRGSTQTDPGNDDDALVIEALRMPGDETQFTRTIALLADRDRQFARSFLALLLDEAPYAAHRGLFAGAVKNAEVTCAAELYVYDCGGSQMGRVDLVFGTADLTVLVEAKLWSDYRENQLGDYLESARSDDGRYVVSVTRNVSVYRDPPESEPQWLGSVRWARLAPRMRDLPRAGPLRHDWNILLDVMSQDGDLGDLELSKPLVDAWTMYDEAADRLTTFLEEVGHDSLAFLSTCLSDRAPDRRERVAAFIPLRKSRSQRAERSPTKPGRVPVKNEGDLLSVRFAIPAGGAQRLEIGFDIPGDAPRFFISAEVLNPQELSPADFSSWRSGHGQLMKRYAGDPAADLGKWDEFCIDVAYPLADFVGDPDVPRRMAELIRENVRAIVDSGLFDGALDDH